jgi:hypothetical protein
MEGESTRQDRDGHAVHEAQLDEMALRASTYAANWTGLPQPDFPCSQTCKKAPRVDTALTLEST